MQHLLTALLVCVLTLTGALAQETTGSGDMVEPGVRVRVSPLADIAIDLARSVAATSVSLRTAVVASELSAQVLEMPVIAGDVVAADALLARLDCRDNILSLQSARSLLKALQARQSLAEQQLERLMRLSKTRNATEEQINQRQAELDIVNAEIATQGIAINAADRQVDRCEIRAPFGGLVTETPGQVGNYLVPGAPVVSLVELERIELKAALLESQVEEVIGNAPVFEFAGRTWSLQVRSVFPVVDQTTQTREVRFRFTTGNPPPGATGRLRWSLEGNILPATFIIERGDHAGLFTVSSRGNTQVTFLPLKDAKPGQPVVTDLADDLLIVTDGRFGLQPNQQVLAE